MWLYFIGLVLGFQMGKGNERVNTKYYNHTDTIMNLENKIKNYETLYGKIQD